MKCPGQDTQYWNQDAIFDAKCPKCRASVEFFKDDTTRRCGKCGHKFVNPGMDFGCAAYCSFAEQCLGTLPPELMAEKEDLLKDRVAIEMKRYFKGDFGEIGRAGRLARHAETLGKAEGGNLPVILCAAYLYRIGKPEAIKRHGVCTPELLAAEGVPVARWILEKLSARAELVEAVARIIGGQHLPCREGDIDCSVVFEANRMEEERERSDA
jgi:hypothetical protein